MSKTMYCPSCGTTAPIEHSLEGEYLLSSCALCGLGLAVTRASRAVKQQYGAIAHSSTGPLPGIGTGPLPGVGTGPIPNLGSGPLPNLGSGPSPSVVTPPARPALGRSTGEVPGVRPAAARATGEVTGVRVASGPLRADSGAVARTSPASLPNIAAAASIDTGMTGAMPVIRGPVKQMRRVYVVEDSEFLRTVTRGLLDERQLAREVVDAADGQVFLEAYTRDLAAGQKPDLIVLDVKMPGMDGREAAHAVRAIESALGVKATPILFFSAMLCDADFKQTLVDLGNARYIRKGDGGDPAALGERIVSVLERLVGARAA
jgi:CheY-like chemotaxis protein